MFARLMGLDVISPGKLQQLMQKQPVSVLDVNSRQSWLTARVPGARPLDPMGYDKSDLPADRDSTLVFYCSNFMCRKAPNAARRAKDMGYRNVYVMSAESAAGSALPCPRNPARSATLRFSKRSSGDPWRCSGQVWRSQELLLLLVSQLYGRGDSAVQFQSEWNNPADFPEVRFEEAWFR